MKYIFLSVIAIMFSVSAYAGNPTFAEQVAMGAQGDHRSESNRARDQYRHPVETLEFFGIKDGYTEMENCPGGGWYTTILAPAMRDHGQLNIATWDPKVEGHPS